MSRPSEKEVAAILLAAGKSSRMGALKSLLPFGRSTVIETCVENLMDGGVDQIVVVVGHRAEDIESRLKEMTVRFALNPEEDSEMADSIACGAKVLDNPEAVLIALVDYPAVPPAIIRQIIGKWQSTGAKIVKPTYMGKGGHPVLIDGTLAQELTKLDSASGLRGLTRGRFSVATLEVDSPYVVEDIDTWDDYRRTHKTVFGYEPPKLDSPRQ